jgi:hypothetical protein
VLLQQRTQWQQQQLGSVATVCCAPHTSHHLTARPLASQVQDPESRCSLSERATGGGCDARTITQHPQGFDGRPDCWCRETDDEDEGAGAEVGSDDGEGEKPLTRGQIIQNAVVYLFIGAAACAFFSDPMVDAVTQFSKVRVRD